MGRARRTLGILAGAGPLAPGALVLSILGMSEPATRPTPAAEDDNG